MRKTIKSLEQNIDACADELKSARAEIEKYRSSLAVARDRTRDLEREVEEVRKKAESDRWMVNGEQYQKGILEGYQQRVREEDAKSLGKLWHEAKDPSISSGWNR